MRAATSRRLAQEFLVIGIWGAHATCSLSFVAVSFSSRRMGAIEIATRCLCRGKAVSEQHAADGLVHQLRLMDGNYHAVRRNLAGLDDNFGNSFAQRALLFD